MEARVIIATIAKTTRENNKIWSVAIEGEEQPKGYCKGAYKAMRFCFLLKKQNEGTNISEECLQLLSEAIKEEKAQKAEEGKEKQPEVAQESSEEQGAGAGQAEAEQPAEKVEKPKRKRKARAKKAEPESLIAFQ